MSAQLGIDDDVLEARIQSAYENLMAAADHDSQRGFAQLLADLVKQRSPARIAQMELERFGRTFG